MAMMTPEQFNEGEALSRRNQPYIGSLMELLADPAQRVTIFVGAGLGIDAGFPNWPKLVDRIADAVGEHEEIDFAAFAKADRDDLMRKAEYLIQALNEKRKYSSNPRDIVREMLYRDQRTTQPGPLAKALALLIKSIAPRVTIITTNFEDVLDRALTEIGVDFELLTLAEYEQANAAKVNGKVPIVHLHGRLDRSFANDIGDVVLTESEFLLHGHGVRKVVAAALENSTTVVLGVSMTDPNLIGPLWDTKGQRGECFVLTVPDPIKGVPLEAARTFGIVKNNYLNEVLGLSPIYLKAYSQLAQLVYELQLGAAEPDSYLRDTSSKSIAYGTRFTNLLQGCYVNLGFSIDDDEVGGGPSDATTAGLRERLAVDGNRKRSADKVANTGELLAHFGRDGDTIKRLEVRRFGTGDVHAVQENFALFLWLRNLASADLTKYSLRIVATSAYQLTDLMAGPLLQIPIAPDSAHTAARSLAIGSGVFWNVPGNVSGGVWAGVATAPVRFVETLSLASSTVDIPTTVGAISLYSTHTFDAPHEDFPAGKHVSLLSVLSVAQKRELLTRLELDARSVLG